MPDSAPQRISEQELVAVRRRISLSDLIRRDIPMKRAGNEWAACCPFHKEKTPSFFVVDKKGFWHCQGCGAHGEHHGWLMRYRKMGFREAHEHLGGIQRNYNQSERFLRSIEAAADEYRETNNAGGSASDDDRAKMHKARAIWENAQPIGGTVAHRYLRARKLVRIPQDWRFVPEMVCNELGRFVKLPTLIVPARDAYDRVVAIQRIFLDEKTAARPINPKTGKKVAKKTFGIFSTGAAVKIGTPIDTLVITEGPEKAVAVKQIFSLPCWSSCGTSGIREPVMRIPETVRNIIIFADYDEIDTRRALQQITADGEVIERPNPMFGKRVGMEAAFSGAAILEQRGYSVEIETPPDGFKDLNEYLEAGV